MIPLAKAQKIAERVAAELQTFCHRIEIAGSIRRCRPEVGDIDLIAEVRDMIGLLERIKARCRVEKSGSQYLVAIMPGGVQIDLWFARPNTPPPQTDFFSLAAPLPPNFGTLLLCRTGSALHNISLAQRAKRLGMHWNPHEGLYINGVCVASKTEEEIYAALSVPFLTPQERELAGRVEQQRLIYGDLKK